MLLMLQAGENAALLAEFLAKHVLVSRATDANDLQGPWDAVILDVHGARLVGEATLEDRKLLEAPV
ncbi:MAG: hypothetical protein RMI39_10560, partial [Thermoanaerobaculum sp.]|nr:hypothetical protein [Thermoanaerobaculum sp.]